MNKLGKHKYLILGGILAAAIGGYVYYRRRTSSTNGITPANPLADGSVKESFIGGANTSPRYIPYNAFPDYPAYPSPLAPNPVVPPAVTPTPTPVAPATPPVMVGVGGSNSGTDQNWGAVNPVLPAEIGHYQPSNTVKGPPPMVGVGMAPPMTPASNPIGQTPLSGLRPHGPTKGNIRDTHTSYH